MHTIKGGCWLLPTNPPPPPDPPPCVSSGAAYVNFRVKLWWRHQFIRHFKIVLLALRINQLARCCVVSANIRRIFCPFSFVFAVCALSLTLSCICFLTQCGLWCQIGQLNLADTSKIEVLNWIVFLLTDKPTRKLQYVRGSSYIAVNYRIPPLRGPFHVIFTSFHHENTSFLQHFSSPDILFHTSFLRWKKQS